MTTIAYRDGVLAADQLLTRNDIVIGLRTKIFRLKSGDLVAGCGNSGAVATLRGWYDAGAKGVQPEAPNSALVVFQCDGGILIFEAGHSHRLDRSAAAFHAFGSGNEIALGAMAAGATAEQAVAAAIALDVYSGGRVDILTLGATS